MRLIIAWLYLIRFLIHSWQEYISPSSFTLPTWPVHTGIFEGIIVSLRVTDGMIQAPVILPSPYQFAVPGLPQRQRPFAGYKRFLYFTSTCNWVRTQHVEPQQRAGCGAIIVSSAVLGS